MASLAATFNSASTLITFDVYRTLHPSATEKTLVCVGRLVTLVMVALGILWVPFIKYLGSEVYIYLQSVQAYISPPIAAVFLLGVFWPRANRQGAIAALIVGAVFGAARFVFELNRASPWVAGSPFLRRMVAVNFQHFAILIFAVSVAILVAVSLLTAAESAGKLRGLTFATLEGPYRPAAAAPSVFRGQVMASGALAALVIGLWIHFR